MRFPAFCACLITAADCAERAVNGDGVILNDAFAWLYWILAIIWLCSGFRILFRGTEA